MTFTEKELALILAAVEAYSSRSDIYKVVNAKLKQLCNSPSVLGVPKGHRISGSR